MNVLECRDLKKVYANGEVYVRALNGVDISLEQGAFCAVTGPSGSGKSTLLHVLGGLEYPPPGKSCIRATTYSRTMTTSSPSCGAGGSGLCSRHTISCRN